MLSPEEFRQKIKVTDDEFNKLSAFEGLLIKWQKSFNLVGPKTMEDIWGRHFLDSAQLHELIVSEMGADPKRAWLDMGAGAGFPGLVVSIMGGGKVYLAESNGKKCNFMRTVIRELGLNAVVLQKRIEQIEPFEVDIITSRALASLEKLLDFSERFVSQNTELWYLKGQDVEDELTATTKYWNVVVDKFKSQTNEAGTILRLRNPKRVRQTDK